MFLSLRVAHFFFMSHFFLWLLFNDVTTLMTEEMSSSFQSHSSRDHPSSWTVARKCRSTGQICQGRFSWFFFHSFRFFLSEFELNLTRFRKAVDQNATRKKKNETTRTELWFPFDLFLFPFYHITHLNILYIFFSLSLFVCPNSLPYPVVFYIYIYIFFWTARLWFRRRERPCAHLPPLSRLLFFVRLCSRKRVVKKNLQWKCCSRRKKKMDNNKERNGS